MIKQKTLKSSLSITGVGIHSGQPVVLTLKPAPVDRGLVFKRVDLTPPVEIPALSKYVGDTRFCTTLIKDGVKLSMVEHVLSALIGLGIDNAIIEVNAQEVPILDGSADGLAQLIEKEGLEAQTAPKKFLKILETLQVQEGDKWAKIEPYNGFKLDFEMVYTHPAIAKQDQKWDIELLALSELSSEPSESSKAKYIQELSKARTFGFLSELEYLKANNLALGGSLENAVVLDESQVMNPEGLRYPNELVRHKILDAIGDLGLLGYSVLGAFSAYKSGHTLNDQLVQKILMTPEAFEIITATELSDLAKSPSF